MQVKKTRKNKAVKIFISVGLLLCIVLAGAKGLPHLLEWSKTAAKYSTMLTMPEGALAGWETYETISGSEGTQTETEEHTFEDVEIESVYGPFKSAIENANNTSGSLKPVNIDTNTQGYVVEKTYTGDLANLTWDNIYVNKKTKDHTIDIAAEIQNRPDIHISKNGEPMVLILHTHGTEAYTARDDGTYDLSEQQRSNDTTQNICRVGEEIAAQLESNGIPTIHDKTLHDDPSYNAAYDRSAETITAYLEKYPSIQVVLDIHRDALSTEDGSIVKPVVEIGGKKAAQIMICAGCEDDQVTDFPGWIENMRFALRIQKACEDNYPGLARPLYFVSKRYNEYMLNGSLLIEIGSQGNTLEEAVYSGRLFGKALVQVLNDLQG